MTTEYRAPRSLPILCIPNVSEGKRPNVVEDLAQAIGSVTGVRPLDYSSDASHNRSLFTVAGEPVRRWRAPAPHRLQHQPRHQQAGRGKSKWRL
jgi:hypothetical protein